MIVDCYTHTWESADQLGRCVPPGGDHAPQSAETDAVARAGTSRHTAAAEPVDTTIVLGFKSNYLDAEIPNDHVASYAGAHPDRMVGFAGIDPSNPREATEELHRAKDELSMAGLAIAPAAQDFHPGNSQAMLVYAEAAAQHMPILFHTGVFISSAAKLEYARPVLLDEVARELPELKVIIAHMGFPWVNETILLLAKHKNVYAETSWLLQQPWQGYQALLAAYQYGVIDKLLFGSGFPSAVASYCIEALYSINHLVHGTNLPTIPREALRGIVERDALSLLGIGGARPRPALQPTAGIAEDEAEEL
jgi:predicted TIM-barrel fold metal-dependent hydrolase